MNPISVRTDSGQLMLLESCLVRLPQPISGRLRFRARRGMATGTRPFAPQHCWLQLGEISSMGSRELEMFGFKALMMFDSHHV